MTRRYQHGFRQGASAPSATVPPAGKSTCGLFALALWLCIDFAFGLAISGLSPLHQQASFVSCGIPVAISPQVLSHAGLERDGAGLPLLSEESAPPLPPFRLDAGEGEVQRHGQKDRSAFHGFAGPAFRSRTDVPADRLASLSLPSSSCRQAWRCFALLALPPPSLHA